MNLSKRIESPPMTLQLAPFLDVMLFLLTFFIVTWSMSRYEAELSINLPTAAEAETSTRMPGEIIINVDREGAIIVNRRSLKPEELKDILSQVTADFPDQAVILRADKQTEYQDVIQVIDVCKAAKVWNIAFTSKNAKQATP